MNASVLVIVTMMDAFFDVFGILIQSLRNNPQIRAWTTGLGLVLLVSSLAILAAAPFLFIQDVAANVRDVAPAVAGGGGFLTFISLAAYSGIKLKGSGRIELESLESIREERQTIQERLHDKPKGDIIDTIQLNLNQLSEYYVINKSQARNSFRFSVFAVISGLVTLVAGVWIFYLRTPPNIEMSIISGAAGVLIQFIGAAYFYLYRTSLEQLNFFFAQLVKMQDTMLSVKLCEQIAPEEKQAALRERIILTLLERSAPSIRVVDSARGAVAAS